MLNHIPGVVLPASRLTLRPSFPVDLIAGSEGFIAAVDAHAWFLDQAVSTPPPDGRAVVVTPSFAKYLSSGDIGTSRIARTT